MQDRYVGDIGDFGKYGLVRFLGEETKLKIGVNWYLVPDEKGNADGMKISYLLDNAHNHKRFKNCDPELYGRLQQIVKPKKTNEKIISEGKRAVSEIKRRRVLSEGTIFYSERLNFDKAAGGNFEIERECWTKKGFECLSGCDILFFDPDNGFPPFNDREREFSTKKNQKKSQKYVYYDEIEDYWYEGKGRSLIIYQHRTMEPEEKYLRRFKRIKDYIPQAQNIFRVRWHPFSVRDYVFVLQPYHQALIMPAIEKLKRRWGEHFSGPHWPFFSANGI